MDEESVRKKERNSSPAYRGLLGKNDLQARIDKAERIYAKCILCPHRCGVKRTEGEKGFCQAPFEAVVSGHFAHPGEEDPLTGRRGSGTIFFSHCNLRCVFCQNFETAHQGLGKKVSDEELARMMLELQRMGCANINLVTPTHFLPRILSALAIAAKEGLSLPIVHNTSSYETKETIDLLDGIVDIYLADMKFMDGKKAARYNESQAADYPEIAKRAISAMHAQVGDLRLHGEKEAYRGLMLRHLVMPRHVNGTRAFVEWVAKNLSPETYVNIMGQYHPRRHMKGFSEIDRGITVQEYLEAIEWARAAGLKNLDKRSLSQYERLRHTYGF